MVHRDSSWLISAQHCSLWINLTQFGFFLLIVTYCISLQPAYCVSFRLTVAYFGSKWFIMAHYGSLWCILTYGGRITSSFIMPHSGDLWLIVAIWMSRGLWVSLWLILAEYGSFWLIVIICGNVGHLTYFHLLWPTVCHCGLFWYIVADWGLYFLTVICVAHCGSFWLITVWSCSFFMSMAKYGSFLLIVFF